MPPLDRIPSAPQHCRTWKSALRLTFRPSMLALLRDTTRRKQDNSRCGNDFPREHLFPHRRIIGGGAPRWNLDRQGCTNANSSDPR